MPDRDAQNAWVGRVLGVDAGQAASLAKSAERGREAQQENKRGIAYPKLLLRWRAAQGEAVGALQHMAKTYLALPEVQADWRFDQAEAVMQSLPAKVTAMGGQLETLLDRGITDGSDVRIAPAAMALIGKYRASINASLTGYEAFAKEYVGDITVVRTLETALAEIEQNLKAAA